MTGMGAYWDERAEENPLYFVDNRLDYTSPDALSFWSSGPEIVERILAELDATIDPGDRIVEIGCGVGRLTRPLAAAGGEVRAVDVSARMLDLAAEHNRDLTNVAWVLGDGVSLAPIATASADACFSHVVFQHLPDPALTLGYVREMGRVLRPGGWAAFGVSDAPEVHRRPPARRRLRAWLAARAGRGPRASSHPAWRGSAVDLQELRSVAQEAGLRVERVSGTGTQFCYVLLRRVAGSPSAAS